ncbi:MAG: T9SS type A sorting domain-containing protein [Bacteroidia bacterium]|nr:T9SS type A sorting domain-containing protein [Bacteroidia bacterium]
MKKIITAFLFAFLSFQNFTGIAQIDTAFWFAVPAVSSDNGPTYAHLLHIYSYGNSATTVQIHQPAANGNYKYDTTFVLGPYSSFNYTFWRYILSSGNYSAYDSLDVRPSDIVLPYGLHIKASSNISVVYDVLGVVNNPETFSLKGANALGLKFYCPFQTKGDNRTYNDMAPPVGIIQPKQQINIVASKINTTVWITPKCNTIGHLANVTFSVLLPNPGSAYTIENSVQTTTIITNNLTGTLIQSDKPIAVTVFDDAVKALGGCYDMVGDQIVPVDKVGTDYVLVKGGVNLSENEGMYVVGTASNTSLTFDDGVVTTTVINAGDTYFYKTNQPLTSLTASKDVYVMHLSGFGCEFAEALLPPLACAGSTLANFTRNNTQNFALSIYCKNGAQNTFTLNGSTTLVPASAFSIVPGTALFPGGPYYSARILFNTTMIPSQTTGTIANSQGEFGLGVCHGGITSGTFYHYATEFLQKTSVAASPSFSICQASSNNMAITLSGTVSGASSTATWTTANGVGTFGVYSSTLNTITTTYTLAGNDINQTSIKFYLTSTGSCKSIKDSLIVYLIPQPVITLASTSTNVCNNNTSPISISATVTNASSGNWSSNGIGTFVTSFPNTMYIPDPLDLQNPPLILTLMIPNVSGCPATAQSLTVNIINTPTVTASTNVPILCVGIGLSATLTASGANTYSWNTSSTNTSIVVSPSTPTTYTVTGFLNGCSNTSTITQATAVCMGVEKNQNVNAILSIYPNPNTGEFVIETNENVQLKLMNELGQVIRTISTNDSANKKTVINCLSKGIYFINGNMNGKAINEKIIVQ